MFDTYTDRLESVIAIKTQIPTNWLSDTGLKMRNKQGVPITVLEFKPGAGKKMLSAWAKRFREHYCLDSQIDVLRSGTGLSRREYLLKNKFPDKTNKLGPSTRSGDFTEILVSDFLEFKKNYWILRSKYRHKDVINESKKGVDVLGMFFNTPRATKNDRLITVEVKAKLVGKKNENVLQKAVDFSAKDILGKSLTLNAAKQRFLESGELDKVARIERFQGTSKPYKYELGAAAVVEDQVFDQNIYSNTKAMESPGDIEIFLLVIKGSSLMTLVHEIYKRVADEA